MKSMHLRRANFTLALISSLLALALGASAQTRVETLAKPKNGFGIVKYGDATIYDIRGNKIGVAPFGTFYYLDEASNGKTKVLKEDNLQLREVGWISTNDLLIDPKQALRVKRENGTDSLIAQKALIVTDWRSLPTEFRDETKAITSQSGIKVTAAQAVKQPGQRSEATNVLQTLGTFNIYFVWEAQKLDGRDWYLLGKLDSLNNPQFDAQTFVGWLPGERLFLWSTRQGVEYNWENRRQRQAAGTTTRVFEEESALRDYVKSGTTSPGVARVDENMTSEAKPLDPKISRFPVLATSRQNASLRPLDGVAKKSYRYGEVYQIGYIGSSLMTGSTLSPEREAVLRQQLEKMKTELRQIDVTIVLDATSSMKPFRSAALNAAQKIMARIKTLAQSYPKDPADPNAQIGPSVRFSIAIYRSYQDQKKSYDRLPFTSDEAKIQQYLNSIDFSSVGTQRNEAVYNGMRRALEDCAAQQTAKEGAFRVMFLIGDSGNYNATDQAQFDSTTNSAKVIGLLNANGYDFYPVHVISDATLAQHDDYRAFRTQMESIAKACKLAQAGNHLKFRQSDVITVSRDDDTQQVEDTIVRIFETHIVPNRDMMYRHMEELRNGKSLISLGEDYGSIISEVVADYLKRNGFDLSSLEKVRVQLFGKGFVTEKDGNGLPQFQPELLVTSSELRQYASHIKQFAPEGSITKASRGEGGQRAALLKAFREQFVGQVGQTMSDSDLENQQIDKLISESAGDLPISEGLMQMTVKQFSERLQSSDPTVVAQVDAALKRIGFAYQILDNYIEGRPFDVEVGPDGTISGVRIRTSEPKKDLWLYQDGINWAWIPLDYFP